MMPTGIMQAYVLLQSNRRLAIKAALASTVQLEGVITLSVLAFVFHLSVGSTLWVEAADFVHT